MSCTVPNHGIYPQVFSWWSSIQLCVWKGGYPVVFTLLSVNFIKSKPFFKNTDQIERDTKTWAKCLSIRQSSLQKTMRV